MEIFTQKNEEGERYEICQGNGFINFAGNWKNVARSIMSMDRETDILDIMKKYDVDTIRIRLWNDPWSENGESYGAGENDLKNTLAIAKKVTDAGLGVLLNFHYSDFWADPGKQIKPKAWEGYSVEELEQAVYDFTADTMKVFKENGINTTMVQVGNELSNGCSGRKERCRIMITLRNSSMPVSVACARWRRMCRS